MVYKLSASSGQAVFTTNYPGLDITKLVSYLWVGFISFWLLFGNNLYENSLSYFNQVETISAQIQQETAANTQAPVVANPSTPIGLSSTSNSDGVLATPVSQAESLNQIKPISLAWVPLLFARGDTLPFGPATSSIVLPTSGSMNSALVQTAPTYRNGLVGTWYNNSDFTSPVAQQTVDFDGGINTTGVGFYNLATALGINNTNFSVRWQGQLNVINTGTYYFKYYWEVSAPEPSFQVYIDSVAATNSCTFGGGNAGCSININTTGWHDITIEYKNNGRDANGYRAESLVINPATGSFREFASGDLRSATPPSFDLGLDASDVTIGSNGQLSVVVHNHGTLSTATGHVSVTDVTNSTTLLDWGLKVISTGSTITLSGNVSLNSSRRLSVQILNSDDIPSNNIAFLDYNVGVPDAPTALTSTGGNRQIALSWSAPTNSGNSAVTSYKVYRSSSATDNTYSLIGTTVSTNYTDANLPDATSYSYKVTAVNSAGEGAFSTATSTATNTAANRAPGVPTGLSATNESSHLQVNLSWTVPADLGNPTLSTYKVYRTSGGPNNPTVTTFNVTAPSSGNTVTFSDSGVAADTTYEYKVTALNSQNLESAYSTPVNIVTNSSTNGATYSLSVSVPNINTWSGGQTVVVATVKNTGSGTLTLTGASVSGLNGASATLKPSPFPNQTLASGSQTEIGLTLSVDSNTAAGPQFPTVVVNATKPDNSTLSATSNQVTLQVQSQSNTSTVNFTLTDSSNGSQVTNATLYVDNDPTPYAANAGIIALPGAHTLYTVAPNYNIQVDQFNVAASGQTYNIPIVLTPGSPVAISDVSTTELSASEAAARGVNLDDPANKVALQFTLFYNISGEALTLPPVIIPKSTAQPVDIAPTYVPASSGGSSSTGSGSGGSTVSGHFAYYQAGGVTYRQETWIIVPGDISILKPFWEAKVYVKNTAISSNPSLVQLTNTHVTLTAPTGLSVQDGNGNFGASATKDLSSPIPAGSGQAVTWTVRGDAVGKYTLHADLSTTVQLPSGPLPNPVTAQSDSGIVEVFQPKLQVDFLIPSQVVAGQSFPLQVTVLNDSARTLYGVTVNLKSNNIINAHVSGSSSLSIGTMLPGQISQVTFTLIPDVSGCINIPKSYAITDPAIIPYLSFQPTGGCPGIVHTFGDCACKTAHPINPVTGNFFEGWEDLSLPAPSGSSQTLALTVKRTYNSLDAGSNGLFGKGWRFTYDMRLVLGASDGSVIVINPDGRQDIYSLNANGSYTAPSRANATLVKNGTSSYTLTTFDQLVYSFDATSGKLNSINDRNNNQVTLSYNPTSGFLSAVSDTYGHQLTFTPTGNNTRIGSISDGIRSVSYGYDATFTYLQTATDTRSYTIRYSYDPTTGLMTDRYDQLNRLVMHNTYDSLKRVQTQTLYADSSTAYTYTFDYTTLTNSTIVTNPRGIGTTYTYDPNSLQPTAVKDALGNTRLVTLNNNDNPTIITATNGNITNVAYNSFGQPTAITTTVTVQGQLQTLVNTIAYNTNNDPSVITDARGFTTSYHYTSAGNADIITDTLGHPTYYNYDSQGHLIQNTSVGGLATTYGYDNLGRTIAVTQTYTTLVGSNTTPVLKSYRTDYQYNSQGWLSYQSDPYDVSNVPSPIPAITYQYDPAGRILTTTNQLGQQAYNQYNEIGNLVSSTNFLGQQTTYGYDWLNRQITTTQVLASGNLVTINSYDGLNNLISSKDPRQITTTYDYDVLNRVITTTTPLQVGGSVRTVNTYDISGNISTATRLNTGTGFSGDQVTHYQYDELNRVVTTTLGYGVLNYQSVNIYDAAGNVIETRQSKGTASPSTVWTDPSQVITSSISYDPLNRPITRTINAWPANKLLPTIYSYNDPQNLSSTTDPYGIITSMQRDAAGRTISTTVTPSSLVAANGATPQTSYSFYDPRGLVLRTIDPMGNWNDTSYDLLGRITSTTQYTSAGSGGTALTSFTYYTDTIRPQVTNIGPAPHYERQDTFLDEAGRTITSTIYAGGPVVYPNVPGGALSTIYGYDQQGNRTSVRDANNHITLFSYENTGWLKTVTQTVTSQGSLQTATTSYNYDLVGNKINTSDAANHMATISYDVLNRMTNEYDALNNHWQISYDGLNRVTSRTDAKNQTTTYSYDNAFRLLSVSSPGNLTTSYAYNDGGQPLTMTDTSPNQTTSYSYDGLNRLVSVTNPQGLVQYTYDPLNRRSNLSFGPSGNQKQVSYQYDALSRPVTITNWLNQPLVYNYSGARLSQLNYPNGVAAAFNFDGADRLTNINQTKGASTIFSATYSLDPLGNRTFVSENLNGTSRNQSYNYDELNRLTKEWLQVGSSQAVSSTYVYDAVGNRSQMNTYLPPNTKAGVGTLVLTTTYSYNSADQMTSRAETGSATPFNGYIYNYQYDSNGSLITETNTASGGEVTGYTWDSRNRLTQVQKRAKGVNLTTAVITYDGKNNRLSMNYGGQTTAYLQDAASDLPVVLQEIAGSQVSSFLYPLDSTSPLFQVDSNNSSLWYHADGLGSVRALTSATGGVVNTDSYSAFGLNAGGSGKAANNHLFAGEQLDPTGLYFDRARYYLPAIGRFIGRDAIAGDDDIPVSENRYAYSWNNPANQTDPSGNFALIPGCQAVVVTVVGFPQVKVVCTVGGDVGTGTVAPPNGGTGQGTNQGGTGPTPGGGWKEIIAKLLELCLVVSAIAGNRGPDPTKNDCIEDYATSLLLAAAKEGSALIDMEKRTSPECMIPVVKFRQPEFPYISRHIHIAQYQRDKPMLLNYFGPWSKKRNGLHPNRQGVCSNDSAIERLKDTFRNENPNNPLLDENLECDEYPFASTFQGGIPGKPGVVFGTSGGPSEMAVPSWENSGRGGTQLSQGRKLSRFYKGGDDNRRGVPMQRGDPFAAVAVL